MVLESDDIIMSLSETEKNIEKSIIDYIKDEVSKLKYKDEEVSLVNVYPSAIEQALGEFEDGYEINGYDCDYWADIDNYTIYGTMKYGTATITLTVGPKKPKKKEVIEDVQKEEVDVYTRTSFDLDGWQQSDVPPVVSCDEETRDKLVAEGILHPFYILFINHYSGHKYVVIYAKEEHDARMRAFSIWYRNWSDIQSEEQWNKLKSSLGDRFENEYRKKEDDLVLKYD